jgi:hypothetical protein
MTIFALNIFISFLNEKNAFLSDDGPAGLLFHRADEGRV